MTTEVGESSISTDKVHMDWKYQGRLYLISKYLVLAKQKGKKEQGSQETVDYREHS